ncbi:GntR family transcriptional regulator [Thalassiella azotivora]
MTGSRFSRLAHELRERIALGELGDSGALESEAELGRRYGVSRVTVRRALEVLRDEGLVESRRGAGWFVTGSSFHQRLAMGTFRHAESAIAEAGAVVDRDVVRFGYEPLPAAQAAALRLQEGADALRSRSVRSVDGVPLDVATEWVPAAYAGAISRADAQRTGIWETLQRGGQRIGTVRQSITAGVTTDDDADLLHVTAGTPVLLVRRLALSAQDAPLALSDHRYLAHRFTLEVEFHGFHVASATEPPGLRAVP